jgi:hypothetical protein
MNKKKGIVKETSWEYVGLGTLLVIVGALMIIEGIEAHNTGTIIPATTKAGPMTGIQSIIAGVLVASMGIGFIGYEILKKIRR